jgi:hypothetical protein
MFTLWEAPAVTFAVALAITLAVALPPPPPPPCCCGWSVVIVMLTVKELLRGGDMVQVRFVPTAQEEALDETVYEDVNEGAVQV